MTSKTNLLSDNRLSIQNREEFTFEAWTPTWELFSVPKIIYRINSENQVLNWKISSFLKPFFLNTSILCIGVVAILFTAGESIYEILENIYFFIILTVIILFANIASLFATHIKVLNRLEK